MAGALGSRRPRTQADGVKHLSSGCLNGTCAFRSYSRLQDFRRIWGEGSGAHPLTIWEPVPSAGYVALGAVATTDNRAPPPHAGYCVRADATRKLPAGSRPVESVRVAPRRDDPFAGAAAPAPAVELCVFDEQLGTMRLRSIGDEGPQPVLALPGATASGSPAGGDAAAAPLSLHLSTGSVSVRVRSILRVPLFEVETAQAIAECTYHGDGRLAATATARPEMWSYNAALETWEPMLDCVPLQVRFFDGVRHARSLVKAVYGC